MSDVVHRVYYVAAIRDRNEARAELAKVKESAAWHERNAKFFSAALTHMTEERDALRDAVESARDSILHERGPMEGEWFTSSQVNAVLSVLDDAIPLPPSAAPAASEPRDLSDMCHPECVLRAGHPGDCKLEGDAEAGAGPKPEFVAPPTCTVCFGGGYYTQETWGSNGYYRKDRVRCNCVQQSPAQPEGGK